MTVDRNVESWENFCAVIGRHSSGEKNLHIGRISLFFLLSNLSPSGETWGGEVTSIIYMVNF